jgi:hypothetical protein
MIVSYLSFLVAFLLGFKMGFRDAGILDVPPSMLPPYIIAIAVVLYVIYFILSTLFVRSPAAIIGGIVGILFAPSVRIGEIPALILLLTLGNTYTRYVDRINKDISDPDQKVIASLLEGIPLGILVGQIIFEF